MEGVRSSSQGQIKSPDIDVCLERIFDIADGSVNRSSSARCHIRKSGHTDRYTWNQHRDNSNNTREC